MRSVGFQICNTTPFLRRWGYKFNASSILSMILSTSLQYIPANKYYCWCYWYSRIWKMMLSFHLHGDPLLVISEFLAFMILMFNSLSTFFCLFVLLCFTFSSNRITMKSSSRQYLENLKVSERLGSHWIFSWKTCQSS